MTHRERILSVIRGKEVDHIPWVPRIDLWYNHHRKNRTLPPGYQGMGIWDILRQLGTALYDREGQVYRETMHNVVVRVRYQNNVWENEDFSRYLTPLQGMPLSVVEQLGLGPGKVTVEYVTPLGTMTAVFTLTSELLQSGVVPLQTEHPITKKEHYRIAEYIVEHTEITPTYDRFLEQEKNLGEDGVVFGKVLYSPIHQFLKGYLGYEKAFYELHDYPHRVEHFLDVLTKQGRRIQQVCADSPAKLIGCGGNFDSTVIGPFFFQQYFMPFFKEFSDILHSRGKYLITHTDGEMKNLLDIFPQSGIDVAEAFTPYPMTSCTVRTVREKWHDKVVIWGGVPTTIMSMGTPEKKFEEYMYRTFAEIGHGGGFILGLGDNLPADANLERVVKIQEMTEKRPL